MRDEYLVIHCSASVDRVGSDADALRHAYDKIVEAVGGKVTVTIGRSLDEDGAHCRAKMPNGVSGNKCAAGYAWVGGDPDLGFERLGTYEESIRDRSVLWTEKYNEMVLEAARWCISLNRDPASRIKFHKEVDDHGKTCPGVGLNPDAFRMDVKFQIDKLTTGQPQVTPEMEERMRRHIEEYKRKEIVRPLAVAMSEERRMNMWGMIVNIFKAAPAIYEIARQAYQNGGRNAARAIVESTDNTYDDNALKAADFIFGWKE